MSSPAPYSKAKRRLVDRLTVRLATAPGSFIYAPHGGVAAVKGRDVVITTSAGWKHILRGVKLKKKGTVRTGDRIGVATGRRIIYKRLSKSGRVVDALSVCNRDDAPKGPKWMRNVKRMPSKNWGVMGPGEERKAVWHTSESGNDSSAVFGVVNWVKKVESEYTIVWNPYTGQLIQIYPAHVGARSVKNGWTVPANRHGKVCIQICVIGRAANAPLSKSPMKGRRRLMEWLDSWGIPRVDITRSDRDVHTWTSRSGHTTHRSAPRPNDHTDPGPIDFKKLFAP